MTYADTTILPGNVYQYRVYAANLAGPSASAGPVSVSVPLAPAAPGSFTATPAPAGKGNTRTVNLAWTMANTANLTGFTIQIANNATFTSGLASVNPAASARSYAWTGLTRNTTYYFRIRANNGVVSSGWVTASATTAP